MCRKQNYISSPSPLFFCWAFSGLHFSEKSFWKSFYELRKGQWVVEQDFHGNSWVNIVTWFLPFSLASFTKSQSCSFWFGFKDPVNLPKFIADKVVLEQ